MTAPLELSVICPVVVGRAQALTVLDRALDLARTGTGQTIVLAGEAGVGKSRLAAEVRARAAAAGFSLFQGHCMEHDRALPYAPFLDLLRAFSAGRPDEDLRRAFGSAAPELARLLPELAPRLSSAPAPPPLEPEQEKHRLFQALFEFFAGFAGLKRKAPVLIVLEDLHWSDDVSLELGLHLARRLISWPILLVLTYRSDEAPPGLTRLLAGLDRERLALEVPLARLGPADVAAMLRAIFGQQRPVHADFLEAIYALTEGNPYFVEELVKALVATGDIYYADGAWDRKPVSDLREARRLPRTVQLAVQQRTDQLSPDARRLLTLAAVIGRRFDFPLLQRLSDQAEAGMLAQVKELMTAQLIVEESADQFAFRHALARQAIYADLLARERRSLHQAVAGALERMAEERGQLDAYLADLSYHFAEAEAWEKSLAYAAQAGERARDLYAPRAAAQHFGRAIEAASRLGQAPPARLLRLRGQAYEALGEFDLARADLEAALKAARAGGDRQAEWRALLDLGSLWASRDYAPAGEYFQQGLSLARALGEAGAIASSLNRVGNWLVNADRPREALAYHEEALRLFEASGDARGRAETLDLLGTAGATLVDIAQSTDYYRRAAALFRGLDDRRGLASSLAMLSLCGTQYLSSVTFWAGQTLEACVRDGEEALDISRAIGWRSGEALALINLGLALGVPGEYGRALEAGRAGLEVAGEIEHAHWATVAHILLGALHLDLCAAAPARQHLEQARALAQETGSDYWAGTLLGFLIPACVAQGDLASAAALDQDFPAEAPMLTLSQRQAWFARAELALAQGDWQRSLSVLDRLAATAPGASQRGEHDMPRLARLRGAALMGGGRLAEAEAALSGARAAALSQGARSLAWRVSHALAELYRRQGRTDEAEAAAGQARQIVEALAQNIPEAGLRADFEANALGSGAPGPPRSTREALKQAFEGLTAREREVAAAVSRGKSNRAIAGELVVSERTVEKHVENILSKLNFHSRAQIAAWAVEKGLTAGSAEA